MRYLSFGELIFLHSQLIERSGGSQGVRDMGLVESALSQPLMTFGGRDLYPEIDEKAAALAYSLICNHPFIDGNKRIGHAAMETFLMLNGFELSAPVDEQERVILGVAAGSITRPVFGEWVKQHLKSSNE